MRRFSWIALATLLLLAGCAPALKSGKPSVAVINAPTEARVPGLAESLQGLLAKTPEASAYTFSTDAAVRFQETHRDMTAGRAPLQAAFIARSLGAAYAVMAGAPHDTHIVSHSFAGTKLRLTLELSGRAQAQIVDPESAKILDTFRSSPFSAHWSTVIQLPLSPESQASNPAAWEALREKLAQEAEARALRKFVTDKLKPPLSEIAGPLSQALAKLLAVQAG
jgi:hypothetical protein